MSLWRVGISSTSLQDMDMDMDGGINASQQPKVRSYIAKFFLPAAASLSTAPSAHP